MNVLLFDESFVFFSLHVLSSELSELVCVAEVNAMGTLCEGLNKILK